MKILLAVDGSSHTKKMLAYLATHKEMFAGKNEYAVLTVQVPVPPRARAMVGKEILATYYAEDAEKILSPVRAFLRRHSLEPSMLRKVGSAGETIAKTAESGEFDLVMMGSHGHTALGNLVMGSVATQVLAQCKVPVLLVR
jgi:nucleotide-binding universal stress UspA family protein